LGTLTVLPPNGHFSDGNGREIALKIDTLSPKAQLFCDNASQLADNAGHASKIPSRLISLAFRSVVFEGKPIFEWKEDREGSGSKGLKDDATDRADGDR
jgi:hypothetical protein